MWSFLARFILQFRIPILAALLITTCVMGYFASKVQMSYEFTRAIPTDNQKYKDYESFKKMFGEDGNMMVIGFTKKDFFTQAFIEDMSTWLNELKAIPGIENTLAIPSSINLTKVETDSSSRLKTTGIFTKGQSAASFDSSAQVFLNLPFYRDLLYNPESHAYLTAIYIKHDVLKSENRVALVKKIKTMTEAFAKAHNLDIHFSGLPFIRTEFAQSVRYEMKLILLISLGLTALILLLFFRSVSAVIFSVVIVLAGVVWALALLYLFGYRITLLSALIAPLIVVIGIPNCIYFLNKYHTQYILHGEKMKALHSMVERMGVVTLFTNLTAAIGFGVFYFTKSQILKEFGLVSGISIIVIFIISLLAIPAIFSFLKVPEERHTRYLDNKYLSALLLRFEYWVLNHSKIIFGFWMILIALSALGMMRLKSVGHIVDDLPKQNKIYTDLKFFEKHFHGVMPLEIVIDTKRKQGAVSLQTLQKMDELSAVLSGHAEMSKPISIVEAVKFARQAYYDGDSSSYGVPNSFDVAFLLPYLKMKSDSGQQTQFSRLVRSFVDSSKRYARISVSMEDVGSVKLPQILKEVNQKAVEIFDTSRYSISYTGTSVVFLEGSKFIISSLVDSILLALLMIIVCMAFLFYSWRIVLISIITNMIPLVITAGVMGVCGIPLKPSTVLVFSIALGIAIDVTIRFLVNYKQDLPLYNYNIPETVNATIRETGISIIYTSLILAAGFVVFLVSEFDGTKALGYLTALTLFLAMITNLTILPVFLVWFDKQKRSNKNQ
ncbi:MAG: MMPL family transporter [Chitinophagaceae bacterium]|nr:MMPL family transporter [Chitinophagaceae bacterium]